MASWVQKQFLVILGEKLKEFIIFKSSFRRSKTHITSLGRPFKKIYKAEFEFLIKIYVSIMRNLIKNSLNFAIMLYFKKFRKYSFGPPRKLLLPLIIFFIVNIVSLCLICLSISPLTYSLHIFPSHSLYISNLRNKYIEKKGKHSTFEKDQVKHLPSRFFTLRLIWVSKIFCLNIMGIL